MIDASYHNRKHERAGRKWRELVMQLNGPAVFSLDLVFATDWFIETYERQHGHPIIQLGLRDIRDVPQSIAYHGYA
ncbi:MAG TPA: hypothetical protein VI094_23065 [Propionibacteriaceae bacterium]